MVLAAPAGIGRETALTMRFASLPVLGNLLTRPSRMGMRMLWSPAFHDPSFVAEGFIETKYALARAPGAHQAVLRTLRSLVSASGSRIEKVAALQAVMRAIHQPTLIVWGQRDRLVPPDHAGIVEAKSIENDPVRRMRSSSAAWTAGTIQRRCSRFSERRRIAAPGAARLERAWINRGKSIGPGAGQDDAARALPSHEPAALTKAALRALPKGSHRLASARPRLCAKNKAMSISQRVNWRPRMTFWVIRDRVVPAASPATFAVHWKQK
jgi:hypothetical protein